MCALLTLVNYFYALPTIVNTTCFPMLLIVAGSQRSVCEMIKNYKDIVVNRSKDRSEVETLTKEDAMWFPVHAGVMLVGLYALIKYFGKEIVNYLLMAYMGFSTGILIKDFLLPLSSAYAVLKERQLLSFSLKQVGIEKIRITSLDVIGLILGECAVGLYLLTRNWILNNILGSVFTVHAIQMMNLGNFQNGFILLSLLFFYDIFFVFGTDVMLTVAKQIDAPIKLLFPRDWTAEEPKFSLLGLGDIVLPGLFIALCLRYDIVKYA